MTSDNAATKDNITLTYHRFVETVKLVLEQRYALESSATAVRVNHIAQINENSCKSCIV